MNLERHPSDERLAALAGAEAEATGDRALGDHVADCERCRGVVDDLSRLRAVLAELPDIAPPRGIRPFPVPLTPASGAPIASTTARASGSLLANLRRALVPAMVAGAALALVGAVGTAGYFDFAARSTGALPALEAAGEGAADVAEDDAAAPGGQPESAPDPSATAAEIYSTATGGATSREAGDGQGTGADADRLAGAARTIPWLVILVAGVVIAAGAFALRLALRRASP